MKIAAAYIRVSDERQDEYSPDSQLKLIIDFAKRNDFIIPQEYVFYDDGISAKSTEKRNRFNDMIAVAKSKEHPFDAIIVWKFSRFARNQEQSIVYKSLLKKNNVDVLSVSEPISSDPFGTLIERIIEWMDEYYLVRLSGEVKRGMTEKATRGEPMCHPAFGYDLKDDVYIPNKNAEAVKMIFNDYTNGIGMRTIALKLNSMGYRTVRGNNFDNRGIEYILNNPVYIGKIRWSKDGRAASKRDYKNENIILSDGKHSPIIDMELWNKAQECLKVQEKKYPKFSRVDQPIEWMLKGLVRCSSCGATLTSTKTKNPGMQCHNYARGICDTSHNITIEKANNIVIEALEDCINTLNFTITPNYKKTAQKQTDYNKLIQAEKRKLARCKESYINGIDTIEEYKTNKEKIQRKIAEIEEKQKQDSSDNHFSPEEYAEKAKEVLAVIKDPSKSEKIKNEALRSIIAYITFQKPEASFKLFFYT